MKKIITTVILLSLACLLMFSCSVAGDSNDTTVSDNPKVTSPDGFEDVTVPPIADKTDAATEENTKTPETELPIGETTDPADEETTSPDAETEDTTAPAESGDEPKVIITTNEEALDAARAYLGTIDEETGYQYAYSNDGMLTENGIEYFKIRVSWIIVEEDRRSLCGYLLVSPYGDVTEYAW